MNSKITDMTKGNPLKLIIMFAIPVMLSNAFQEIYTVIDTLIISRGVGIQALVALGVTSWMTWIMTGSIVGLCQGFTVVISQKFGEKDYDGMRKSVAMVILCAAGSTLILVILLQAILEKELMWLNTTEESYPYALAYCRVYYMGAFAAMLYNVQAAFLRALGDSRTPLIAMIFATVLNVVLDLLLVMGFHLGVEGAAAATILAQICSALYCFLVIRRQKILVPRKEDWKVDFSIIKRILVLSAPMVFEATVISIGGLIVQAVVDAYGTALTAGFAATNRIYLLLNVIGSAIGAATAVFVGQNYGAGLPQRIRKGMRQSIAAAVLSSAAISMIILLFGTDIISVFITKGTDYTEQAVIHGTIYLRTFGMFLWAMYLSAVFRYALQGLGRSGSILVSGFFGFAMRGGVALFLPQIFGMCILYYDEVIAAVFEMLVVMISYGLWFLRHDFSQKKG